MHADALIPEKLPAAHVPQVEVPVADVNLPDEQAAHPPAKIPVDPRWQATHAVRLSKAVAVPRGQEVHVSAPAAEMVLGLHVLQLALFSVYW